MIARSLRRSSNACVSATNSPSVDAAIEQQREAAHDVGADAEHA